MCMLWVLLPRAIVPEAQLANMIPYDDCVAMAARVAKYYYYDNIEYITKPEVYCQ